MVKQLQPARASALPASPGSAVPPGSGSIPGPAAGSGTGPAAGSGSTSGLAAVTATAPGLLMLVVGFLLIPGTFQIAGSVLSPYRVLLLGLFPFLLRRWLVDTAGRPSTVDLLIFASAFWMGLSLIANHGLSTFPRATIVFIEMFGGYLIGRTLIRNRIDHRNYFQYLTAALVILLPFLLLEAATLINIPARLADLVLTVPVRTTHLGYRLGIHRVQGTLEHPILFGLVASLGVANAAYIWRRSLYQAALRTLLFAGTVFLTVSSGPLLAVAIQFFLIAWDRGLAFLRFRWLLLAYLVLLGLFAVKLGEQFHVRDFIVAHLSYSQSSAEGRFVVFDYGMMEVKRHPLFGIGLNDWTRPWWRENEPTFDNFWLGYAMRYGVPAFAFLVLGWAFGFLRIAMQKTLTAEEGDYRKGYLITLTGLTIVLGTVNMWSATLVFVMIYIGAGGWFYLQPRAAAAGDEAARERRAAQARAFGGVAPALAATAGVAAAASAAGAGRSGRRRAGEAGRGRGAGRGLPPQSGRVPT